MPEYAFREYIGECFCTLVSLYGSRFCAAGFMYVLRRLFDIEATRA